MATKKKVVKKVKKQLVNRITLVLDDSGSMQGIKHATLNAFNKTLEDIKANAAKTGQKTFVSFIKFGLGTPIRVFSEIPVEEVKVLDAFNPNASGTALLDGVAAAINDGEARPFSDSKDVSYLLIVLTDGYENASSISPSALVKLISKVQGTDRWTITFQVPNGNKYPLVNQFGIPEGNVVEWEQSNAGAHTASLLRDAGLSNYFAARSSGLTSSKSFYVTTDLSNVKAATLKKKLEDLSSDVKIWKVDGEEEIQPFIERHTHKPLVKGTAFYQLTKTEREIQPYKKILIAEKGKKAVYGGDDARTLLGLPLGVTCKVEPGNHANYDVFVQSTSTNRKLVRGTKVVYYPGA